MKPVDATMEVKRKMGKYRITKSFIKVECKAKIIYWEELVLVAVKKGVEDEVMQEE